MPRNLLRVDRLGFLEEYGKERNNYLGDYCNYNRRYYTGHYLFYSFQVDANCSGGGYNGL